MHAYKQTYIDLSRTGNCVKIYEHSGFRIGLELLGDPSGAKMAQDATWIACGAEFGDVLGSSCGQDGPTYAKMVPTWSPRWLTCHHFWGAFWVLFVFVYMGGLFVSRGGSKMSFSMYHPTTRGRESESQLLFWTQKSSFN